MLIDVPGLNGFWYQFQHGELSHKQTQFYRQQLQVLEFISPDTVYPEVASGPTEQEFRPAGLLPAPPTCPHFRRQSQTHVVTHTSDCPNINQRVPGLPPQVRLIGLIGSQNSEAFYFLDDQFVM